MGPLGLRTACSSLQRFSYRDKDNKFVMGPMSLSNHNGGDGSMI
jgi:hypothetical protein